MSFNFSLYRLLTKPSAPTSSSVTRSLPRSIKIRRVTRPDQVHLVSMSLGRKLNLQFPKTGKFDLPSQLIPRSKTLSK